jgi:hypothetical protein
MLQPALTHIADFTIRVGAPITIGDSGEGLRRVVPIVGGEIRGGEIRGGALNGRILEGGADYQLIRQDGFTTMDARYVAELDDGHLLYIVNSGVRFGPAEIMARITRGEPVDPADVYFRTTPRFETVSPAHGWLSRPLFLASGARHPDRVDLAVYQVR